MEEIKTCHNCGHWRITHCHIGKMSIFCENQSHWCKKYEYDIQDDYRELGLNSMGRATNL